MVTTVSENPRASCRVSAVPTYRWSATSVTMVENCAESATTQKPHTSPTATGTHAGAPSVRPMTALAAPEETIATDVSQARPCRSASRPPTTHPAAPTAMVANAAAGAAHPGVPPASSNATR
jgi:hypothetical protein